jgi:hypothetical protein
MGNLLLSSKTYFVGVPTIGKVAYPHILNGVCAAVKDEIPAPVTTPLGVPSGEDYNILFNRGS